MLGVIIRAIIGARTSQGTLEGIHKYFLEKKSVETFTEKCSSQLLEENLDKFLEKFMELWSNQQSNLTIIDS